MNLEDLSDFFFDTFFGQFLFDFRIYLSLPVSKIDKSR